MRFIDLAFHLGVLFAAFGFLWGLIRIFIGIMRFNHAKRTVFEEYTVKLIQYFFLADVTFLFCLKDNRTQEVLQSELLLSASILVLYFLGKLQNRQNRFLMFRGFGNSLNQFQPIFHLYAEISVILFGLGTFFFYSFYPLYAMNPISNWFYDTIIRLENVPVFGFIIKVFGFFVLINIFNKIINGLFFLISGKPFIQTSSEFNFNSDNNDTTKFDDYEEL